MLDLNNCNGNNYIVNKEKKNILILDGVSSQGLPIMRSFYKSGHKVTIVSSHRLCAGFFSRYAHKKMIWPLLYKNDSNTLNRLINYLKKNKIDLVLGLGDKTAHLLSKNKKKLGQLTKTIVPDYEVFSAASDKLQTMKFCMENGIPCPLTLDGENVNIGIVETLIKFPVIVKPKKGVGSVGVFKYTNPEILKKDFEGLKTNFGSLIIQEFIPNEEQYTVEVVCDKESKVKACIVVAKARFFPVSGGTSSCNITVGKPEIESVIIKFLEKLRWIGNANLDIIYDVRDNTPKIIEINPRVGAMVKIAFESGVDIAKMQYQLAFEPKVQEQREYKKEIVLRNLLLEIFWLFSSTIRDLRNSNPSFICFFGRNVFYENFRIDNPFTSLGYFFGNLRKYLNPKIFSKKFLKKQ